MIGRGSEGPRETTIGSIVEPGTTEIDAVPAGGAPADLADPADNPPPPATEPGIDRFRWAMAGLVVLAAIVRFVGLGHRPMHHDESLDAWFAWRFRHGQPYTYDPVYHGPLRFYLTAAAYTLFGESEASARMLAAACGTAVVAVIGGFRRWLGDVGTIAAAAMAAISPSLVAFSRFGREDSPMALLELALLLVVARWLDEPRRWHPPVALALLAAAFATKETTFILVAVMGSYVLVLGAVDELRHRRRRGRPTVLGAVAAPGWRAWALGVLAFALVFSALFSVWFTHLPGIVDGAVDGIRYWLSQQPVNRGSMRWPFYVIVLLGYEWPIVLLAGVGAAVVLHRRDRVLGLVAWTALGNLAVYSWASERFPWLVIHPLIPIVLLAGVGAQRLWDRRPDLAVARRGPELVAVALAVLALVTTSVRVNFVAPSDPRQLLVAVQTSDDVPPIVRRIDALFDASPPDAPPRVVIDTGYGATWPFAWYLRDHPVLFADLAQDPSAAAGADAVLALAQDVPALQPPAAGWVGQPYAHRVWWLPPWDDASLGDWLGWIANRRTFGPLGQLDSVFLLRVGAPGGDG